MKTAALRGAPALRLPPTRRTGSTATAATASSLDTMRYIGTFLLLSSFGVVIKIFLKYIFVKTFLKPHFMKRYQYCNIYY